MKLRLRRPKQRPKHRVEVDCTCRMELGILAKTSMRKCPVHGKLFKQPDPSPKRRR